MTEMTQNHKKLTKGDLRSMYMRSTFLLGSFNFERMQSMGFCVTMMPAIKRLQQKRRPGGSAEAPRRILQHPAVDRLCHHGRHRGDGRRTRQRRPD